MPIDLYLVKLLVGDEGTPGAPLLHISAAVDAPTGEITGQAEITQTVDPPEGNIRINDLRGQIHYLGFGEPLRAVALTGSFRYLFPPTQPGQGVGQFSAALVVEEDRWNGRGSFTYGDHKVDDVPVRAVE
jgi:hypothetical protein